MKKTSILLISSLIFLSISCVKDLSKINEDPNNQKTVDPHLVFKFSVKRGMGNFLTASHMEYNGLHQYMMYFAKRGGVEPGKEYIQPAGADGFWTENYVDALNNAQVIIRAAESDPALKNMAAAAIIWKVFLTQRITDLWGDIPYSKAFQGNPELEFTPEYDTQKEIYYSFLLELEQAVSSFDETNEFFTTESDLIYGGSVENWIRFGNSLRLRIATRINKVDPQLSASVINDLQDELLIESNDQIASFQFNSVFNKPLYEAGFIQYEQGEQYINPSKYLVDLLIETDDPRKPIIVNKTTLSNQFPFLDNYKGVPNLLPYNNDIWEQYNLDALLTGNPQGQYGDVSRIGDWYLNNERPYPLITYSEVCFLKAEAALNGIWEGNATDFYMEGILSHMEYINLYASEDQTIPDLLITNYLNIDGTITLEDIISQKYILFAYENVYEAYAEYRRTGFPVLTDYFGQAIDADIFPNRLKYPYSEFNLNRENYQNAVVRQGPDNSQTHLWWDID